MIWPRRRGLNLSGCKKFNLSATWAHDQVTQLVRASERNSVVVSSNPIPANFLSTFFIFSKVISDVNSQNNRQNSCI